MWDEVFFLRKEQGLRTYVISLFLVAGAPTVQGLLQVEGSWGAPSGQVMLDGCRCFHRGWET